MSLIERFRSQAAEEPYDGSNLLSAVRVVEKGLMDDVWVRRLAEQMAGREPMTPDLMDHWLRVNLKQRRDFLAKEHNPTRQVDQYAFDIADRLNFALHVAGGVLSDEVYLPVAGFDFDDAIVAAAVVRVSKYYQVLGGGFRVHYSTLPGARPLELTGEPPLHYRIHSLAVMGWSQPKPAPNGKAGN